MVPVAVVYDDVTVLFPCSRSWYEIMVLVYNDHGVTKGLFRGMSINYLRIMPMVGISFTVYEMMKQFLGLDTGFDR